MIIQVLAVIGVYLIIGLITLGIAWAFGVTPNGVGRNLDEIDVICILILGPIATMIVFLVIVSNLIKLIPYRKNNG